MSPRAVTDAVATNIWGDLRAGVSREELAKRFNVGIKVIEGIAEGRTYRDVTGGSIVPFNEASPKAPSKPTTHPKVITPKSEMAYVTEPAKCAGCGELFMLDSRFKAERMKDGDYFYCPQGCSLTYDKGREVAALQEEESQAREWSPTFVMHHDLHSLAAQQMKNPEDPKQEDYWWVKFDGTVPSHVLNEIVHEMWDKLMTQQGIAVDELGSRLNGTIRGEIRSEMIDALKQFTGKEPESKY